jgi:hypothetical protein
MLVLGVLGVRFGPAVTLALTLAMPASEPWLAALLPEPAREEIVVPNAGRAIVADLYRPPKPRAALLLVHGLSRAGRRHPELVRLARLLARHGQLVLVPEFEGLVEFRLSGAEVEDIRTALSALAARGYPVGIAGFSFGAGPALLAAADVGDLRLAASFGGYGDLRNVIAYVTTGVHTFHGQRYVQRHEEYNRWKLLALLAGFLDSDPDRRMLGAIAARRLADPASDTEALETALGPEGRPALRLALNRDERAVITLLDALPAHMQQALNSLSPLPMVPRLHGRLLIAHGAADESIPFTESLRLAETAAGRAQLAILHTFHHTGPQPAWPSIREHLEDACSLVWLAEGLLSGSGALRPVREPDVKLPGSADRHEAHGLLVGPDR